MLKSVSTTAPGKIILCGEHAVVYGKEAIACCLDLRTKCTIDVTENDQHLKVSFPELNVEGSWKMESICSLVSSVSVPQIPCLVKIEELGCFIDGCYDDELQKLAVNVVLSLYISIAASYFNGKNVGLNIIISSDLPIGSGLGSSASLSVSVASSLLLLCGFIGNEQKCWSDVDYKLINDWAFEGEKLVHGEPSGIDNSVSTFGHFLSYKAGHIQCLPDLINLQFDMLVVNTKVPRSTKLMVAGVRSRKEKFSNLYANIFQSIESVTECFKKSLLKLTSDKISAASKDYTDIEHLVDVNQCLLDAIGVGHSDITQVVNICKAHSLHSKLTGAGGGGCVIVLIPPSLHEDRLQIVTEELKNVGYDCFRTSLGGNGIHLLDIS